MAFWDFLLAVPAPARLALSLAITIGISLLMVGLLYPRLLAIYAGGQKSFETHPGVNRPNDAVARFTPFMTIAFLFLAGLTVTQFWSNARIATDATSAEQASYARAVEYAGQIPADQGRDEILAALDAYRVSVTDQQWPLLQHAEASPAYDLQAEAVHAVRTAVTSSADAGAAQARVWDDLTAAVDDMSLAGTDRINSVPQGNTLMLLTLVLLLGVLNLVVLGIASPSTRGLSLLLMGFAGGVAGLIMFVAVELSNPYIAGVHAVLVSR